MYIQQCPASTVKQQIRRASVDCAYARRHVPPPIILERRVYSRRTVLTLYLKNVAQQRQGNRSHHFHSATDEHRVTRIHSAAITGHSLLAALAIVVIRSRFAIRAEMQRQCFSFFQPFQFFTEGKLPVQQPIQLSASLWSSPFPICLDRFECLD
jgi:hypothetical protein